MRNSKGFTLVEMIVAMGIFTVVMMMAGYAFQQVLATSGQQGKSAQSNIDGIAGLELLRYDVEHAGYGLPWRFQSYTGTIQFQNAGLNNREVDVAADATAVGFDPTTLNATMSTDIKAIAAGTVTKEVNGTAVTNVREGPDYLVIRSTMASLSGPARKWSYINYSATSSENLSHIKLWNSADDFTLNDRIVTVSSTFTTTGKQDKILLMNGNNFEVTLPASLALPAGAAFKPADASQVVVAYGVRNHATSGLRMPYHRTDYYISRPATGMPGYCSPGTGILYKAVVDHATGAFNPRDPVLDCVGDMQVEFDYDANDNGNVVPLIPYELFQKNAAEIRDSLKSVRIYILAHEGKKDRTYTYPSDSIQVGDRSRTSSSGRTLSSTDMATLFGADWRQYRWKVYTIVTRPKNLTQ